MIAIKQEPKNRTNKMTAGEYIQEAEKAFVPCYSVSLLYQKGNKVAMRVFISDARNEQDAVNEARSLYRWTMNNYKLIQWIAARINCSRDMA